MNLNLEQLHTLKTLTLTETERGRIRSHAVHVMNTSPARSRPHALLQRGLHHTLRIALSSFLFFIFIGGTVSAVADNALPGDPLYAFKLNVNEEVQGLFQKTPQQKVAYNTERVENRVKEIKTLAESKTLTKAKQATVQKALDEHIKDLSDNLNTLSTVAPIAALDATTTLEDTLKANKAVLESTDDEENTGKAAALSTVDGTIQKVSNQEVKLISKEIDSISSDIAATPAVVIDAPISSTPNETDPTKDTAVAKPTDTKDITPVGP